MEFFKNISMRGKLSFAIGLMLVLMGVLAVSGYMGLRQSIQAQENASKEARLLVALTDLKANINESRLSVMMAIASTNEADKKVWEQQVERITSENERILKLIESTRSQDSELVNKLNQFSGERKTYGERRRRILNLAAAGNMTDAMELSSGLNKLNTVISYPKNRINVLLLENVHPAAVELLKGEGFNVEVYHAALTEDELCEKIKNVSVLGIRSKTQVTAKVLENANRLMAIGAFCIGTNQIDLKTATKKGIAVFNAPFSNTRSVVELAIAEMIMLIRNIVDKSVKMHKGVWDKSAKGSFEVRGKSLGLIGYGSIGTQLSVIAESLGMKVLYYDTEERLSLGNAIKCKSMKEVLEQADVISLHVDGRESNTNLIGAREFDIMKKGVIFINLSRGHIVDIQALREIF